MKTLVVGPTCAATLHHRRPQLPKQHHCGLCHLQLTPPRPYRKNAPAPQSEARRAHRMTAFFPGSDIKVPTCAMKVADERLRLQDEHLVEPEFAPPTRHYEWEGPALPGTKNRPVIR